MPMMVTPISGFMVMATRVPMSDVLIGLRLCYCLLAYSLFPFPVLMTQIGMKTP